MQAKYKISYVSILFLWVSPIWNRLSVWRLKLQQYLENFPYDSLVGIVTFVFNYKINHIYFCIKMLHTFINVFSVSSKFYVKGRYGQNFMSNVRVFCRICQLRLISDLRASCQRSVVLLIYCLQGFGVKVQTAACT